MTDCIAWEDARVNSLIARNILLGFELEHAMNAEELEREKYDDLCDRCINRGEHISENRLYGQRIEHEWRWGIRQGISREIEENKQQISDTRRKIDRLYSELYKAAA